MSTLLPWWDITDPLTAPKSHTLSEKRHGHGANLARSMGGLLVRWEAGR